MARVPQQAAKAIWLLPPNLVPTFSPFQIAPVSWHHKNQFPLVEKHLKKHLRSFETPKSPHYSKKSDIPSKATLSNKGRGGW